MKFGSFYRFFLLRPLILEQVYLLLHRVGLLVHLVEHGLAILFIGLDFGAPFLGDLHSVLHAL